jgi:hypothetical protein
MQKYYSEFLLVYLGNYSEGGQIFNTFSFWGYRGVTLKESAFESVSFQPSKIKQKKKKSKFENKTQTWCETFYTVTPNLSLPSDKFSG